MTDELKTWFSSEVGICEKKANGSNTPEPSPDKKHEFLLLLKDFKTKFSNKATCETHVNTCPILYVCSFFFEKSAYRSGRVC